MSHSFVAHSNFPTPARARYALSALSILGFFLSMDITLTTLLIEPMKRDMSLTDLEVGLLQGTAFGLALGIASIPAGRLIDRAIRMRLLFWGLFSWIIAMIITGLAPNFASLVAARAVLGANAALLVPAAFSLAADLYPPERRSVATSMLVVGQATGQGIGVLAGGLAFDALTGWHEVDPSLLFGLPPWRLLYLAAAILGLAILLLLTPVREPTRQEQQDQTGKTSVALRELWQYRGFLLPLIIALLLSQVTIQAASVWATPILIRNHHLTPGQFAGWLSAVLLIGGIAGAAGSGLLGKLGQRYGGRAGVLVPAVIAALAIAPLSLFGMAYSVPLFAVMLTAHIFTGAVIATLGVIAITLNIPNEVRGLALGTSTLLTAIFASATAPPLIALVSSSLGGESQLGIAIAALCIPCALGAALCFWKTVRFFR